MLDIIASPNPSIEAFLIVIPLGVALWAIIWSQL